MKQDNEQIFKETIMTLFDKATADGTISPEIGLMMMKVKLDLSKYIETVEQSEAEGKLSIQEVMQLDEMKNKIIANAGIIAADDYVISDDEKKFIKKLAEILYEKF